MSAPVSESPYTYDYEDRKNNGSDDGTYPKSKISLRRYISIDICF